MDIGPQHDEAPGRLEDGMKRYFWDIVFWIVVLIVALTMGYLRYQYDRAVVRSIVNEVERCKS
jgi:choline-glycine betaine transporter